MKINWQRDPWPYPALFAHRGGGKLAPENTLAAMRVGVQCGYRAMEFDVKLSRDNQSFLLHDDTLERTSNGNGVAREWDWAALQLLDAGSWFGPSFAGEPVPSFAAIAAYLQRQQRLANVEIKPCPGREAETGTLIGQQCMQLWGEATEPPLVTSFSVEALRHARKAAPTLALGLLVEQPAATDLLLLAELGAVSLHCDHRYITPQWVENFHHAGYRVLTYTVNEVARAESLFAMEVDGIFTDNLVEMAQRFLPSQ